VRLGAIALTLVGIHPEAPPVEVNVEDGMILEHPVIVLGHEGLQDGCGDLPMIERPERLANVVEERAHDVLLVTPVAEGAGGSLEVVLEPIHRICLIRAEIREELWNRAPGGFLEGRSLRMADYVGGAAATPRGVAVSEVCLEGCST